MYVQTSLGDIYRIRKLRNKELNRVDNRWKNKWVELGIYTTNAIKKAIEDRELIPITKNMAELLIRTKNEISVSKSYPQSRNDTASQ